MVRWTNDLILFIRIHLCSGKLILSRFLFSFFTHSAVFHIQLNSMFLVIFIVVKTSISCICWCGMWIASIRHMIAFHKWNICSKIIDVTWYIYMSYISLTASNLYIISRLEYIGMVIVIVFHVHERCIWIRLRKTVLISCNIRIYGVFKHLQRIFFKCFLIPLQFMLLFTFSMHNLDWILRHQLFYYRNYFKQIIEINFSYNWKTNIQIVFWTIFIKRRKPVHNFDPTLFSEFFCGFHPYKSHLIGIGLKFGSINI